MKKITLITSFFITLFFSACAPNNNQSKNSSQSTSDQSSSLSNSTTSLSDNTSTSKSASNNSTSFENQQNLPKEPEEIYNLLKGTWHSKEVEGNNVQWEAIFTDRSAVINPISETKNMLNFKIKTIDWNENEQRLYIKNEAFTSDGAASPENDYILSVHDIDFQSFAKISVSSSAYATTDLTFYRQ